ncbi:MAG: hypothetical protein M1830_003752, partial [Pleopsidium flavum]
GEPSWHNGTEVTVYLNRQVFTSIIPIKRTSSTAMMEMKQRKGGKKLVNAAEKKENARTLRQKLDEARRYGSVPVKASMD